MKVPNSLFVVFLKFVISFLLDKVPSFGSGHSDDDLFLDDEDHFNIIPFEISMSKFQNQSEIGDRHTVDGQINDEADLKNNFSFRSRCRSFSAPNLRNIHSRSSVLDRLRSLSDPTVNKSELITPFEGTFVAFTLHLLDLELNDVAHYEVVTALCRSLATALKVSESSIAVVPVAGAEYKKKSVEGTQVEVTVVGLNGSAEIDRIKSALWSISRNRDVKFLQPLLDVETFGQSLVDDGSVVVLGGSARESLLLKKGATARSPQSQNLACHLVYPSVSSFLPRYLEPTFVDVSIRKNELLS